MYGGLRLTYATLATFTKYPKDSRPAERKGRVSQKKYGFTQSERDLFIDVAARLKLKEISDQSWCRHPLAFLVEAADDICYNIIDLEDGTRLGLVDFDVTKNFLAAIIGDRFSEEKLARIADFNEKLGTLRALAISTLIYQTVACFLENEEAMLSGEFDTSLTDLIPAAKPLNDIKELSIQKIYRSKHVLEREAAGFEVLDKRMEAFTMAVYHSKIDKEHRSAKHRSLFRLIPLAYQLELENEELTLYQSLQIVSDFIASLTDSAALKLHQTILGVRIS
jgi:dGTPase